jgi:hypothetical protein
LELSIPSERPLIVTNDGTALTEELVRALSSEGWKVVVWDFPKEILDPTTNTIPDTIHRVKQVEPGKEGIDKSLATLRDSTAPPAGLIHLHPHSTGEGLFSDREQELIKQVFLISGSVKDDLISVEPGHRNLFVVVTRTDGSLGISGTGQFQEGSGLTGLVKTLRWEWPEVFCRAIDLDRSLSHPEASQHLLREIYDPDRNLAEVGLSKEGRVTLERKEITT